MIGTFATGTAQVDIKGHVRRGDIQIPIVDDSLAPARPATSTRHKPVTPVPTDTCDSSSTERQQPAPPSISHNIPEKPLD
ncbi:hypothetical protein C0Q70_01274 [Pomacea canaliculata]|uniref:Uncharacterized protein n=1 Tax=Pomacea canaliculata TaxID=400727 RepID=A0A2T7PYZ6_POMCA|nr:hypothetical protein C0Q70_01274 [Pomacea canaliculata]